MLALPLKRGLSILCMTLCACSGGKGNEQPKVRGVEAPYALDRPTDALVSPVLRDGSFMRGVCLGPLVSDGDDVAQRATYARALDAALSLGATDLELTVRWAQSERLSVEIAPQDQTVEDALLAWVMDEAHARKLRVMLTPTVVVDATPERPSPAPEARERWWWSYRRFIMSYARIAGQHHAGVFSLGVDLPPMASDTGAVEALIRDVRKVYQGKLVYSARAADLDKVQIWSLVDFAGVGFSLDAGAARTADDARLAIQLAQETERLRGFSQRAQRDLILTDSVRNVERDAPKGAVPTALEALRYGRGMFHAWNDVTPLRGVFAKVAELGSATRTPDAVHAVLTYWYSRSRSP